MVIIRTVFGFKSALLFYSSSPEDAGGDGEKGKFMRKGKELSICYTAHEKAIGFPVSDIWRTAGEGSE